METNGLQARQRQLMIVVNPASGTLSKRGLLKAVHRHLDPLGYGLDVRLTRAPGHATELAAEAARLGYYGVLAVGGDGTVNEVAQSLVGTRTALGIIPSGSGNGLARHLDIPVDPDRSLQVITHDHIVPCDYGTAQGRPFFCTFGVGFDAAVSERFARQKRRGLNMYLKSAIDEFLQYSPEQYTIIMGDRVVTEQALLVVAANASQYGNNAFIAPEASITDGLLDITVVRSGNMLSEAIFGVDLLTGYVGKNVLVETFRTPGAVIRRSTAGPAHIDGDPCTMPAEITVRCHGRSLPVFTPESHGRFRPLLTPAALMLRDWGIALHRLFK